MPNFFLIGKFWIRRDPLPFGGKLKKTNFVMKKKSVFYDKTLLE